MKKLSLVMCVLALAGSIFAETEKTGDLTPEQRSVRRAKIQEVRQKTTGGYLVKEGSQKGRIAFFNCQKAVSENALVKTATDLTRTFGLNFQVQSNPPITALGDFVSTLKAKSADFGVFVVDDANSPCTLGVYPEQRFAVLNVNAIGNKPERTQMELVRAFVMLCGGLSSSEIGSILYPVSTPIDLDTIKEMSLPYDAVNRMMPYLQTFGVTPIYRRSYKTACQEGWAPAPTNDNQKAIWEKVHAPPSKPIKITFDKEKQKPVVK